MLLPTRPPTKLQLAFRDIQEGLRLREVWLFLGWRDVQKQYSRSLLGPLWVTISMGFMIGGLGLLYSEIFHTDLQHYLPFLTIGFVIWNLISGLVVGACNVFSTDSSSIKQIPLPLSFYIWKMIWNQTILFFHNFIIYVVLAIVLGLWPGPMIVLCVPAFVLIALNGFFIAVILGPICARFRDVPMIVASVMQLAFFVTPIIWQPSQLPKRAIFLSANPFYHFVEIIRSPLLGGTGGLDNWTICLAITGIMALVSIIFYSRFRGRIAYWI